MTDVTTDRIVIVGAGLGALYAALKLAPHPVVVVSPDALGKGASSSHAQGGVAAAMSEADSPQIHASDTKKAGAGTVDANVADLVTRDAGDHILDLVSLGAQFDRSPTGEFVLSREAAHSFARVVRVKGDQAGAEIMSTLVAKVRNTPSVQILEGAMAVSLDTENGAVCGVGLQSSGDTPTKTVMLRGSGYLLAGGGSGGLYARTTNPLRINGQVIGMAAQAGAKIADAEFVQFHPTAMDFGEDPTPLATEALRGEGAVLVNSNGERFMLAEHADAELAPRDIVARAIHKQTQAGLRPMLDTRHALGTQITEMFPAVAQACLRNGVDPVTNPIPVVAAAHYHMGGIASDNQGRTSLKNLWVCGEAASTGLHGANRLASNGLLEALYFARNCAESIRSELCEVSESSTVQINFAQGGLSLDLDAVDHLRQTMTNYVGVVRNGTGLRTALDRISALQKKYSDNIPFQNMCATATLIAASALQRCESRGAHYRTDFPLPSETSAVRSFIYLSEALSLRDQSQKEIA